MAIERVILRIKLPEIVAFSVTDDYLRSCATKKLRLGERKQKERLMPYLKKGKFISILLDLTKCIFDNQSISHMMTLCSNGEWMWSADLNHYSEKHQFIWPKEFIESVKVQHYQMPKLTNKQLQHLGFIATCYQSREKPYESWTKEICNLGPPFPTICPISTYHEQKL